MREWEYKVMGIPMLVGNMESAFNELGSEGWEMILADWGRGVAIFKRPKP